jgi:hypothetical protein
MGSNASHPASKTRIGKLASGVVLAGVVCLGASTCTGGGGGEDQAAQDTLTRRQKDSIISTLPVPGAGAVGKALEASDAARARAELHDTIG